MQKIEISIVNNENINHLSQEQQKSIVEIVSALIHSGSLTGVKGGKTIIHFDSFGVFQGIELDYWPWRRKKNVDKTD